MKHRHLTQETLSPAAIEGILDRGTMRGWVPLIKAIKSDPTGPVANITLPLCTASREEPLYGRAVFRRVVEDTRRVRPGKMISSACYIPIDANPPPRE